MRGSLRMDCGGDERVRSFRLWDFCESLTRAIRARCCANKSFAEVNTSVTAAVVIELKRCPSRSVRFTRDAHSMAKRGTKATRKFAASGLLTKKIQARRKHQQIQRKSQNNKGAKSRRREPAQAESGDSENEAPSAKAKERKSRYATFSLSIHSGEFISPVLGCSLKDMSVDDFLGASFMEEDGEVSAALPTSNPNITSPEGRRAGRRYFRVRGRRRRR